MQNQIDENEITVAEQKEHERFDRAAKIERDRENGCEVVTFSKEDKPFAKNVRGLRREVTKALDKFRGGFGSEVPERFASEIQSLCQDLRAAKGKMDSLLGKDDGE